VATRRKVDSTEQGTLLGSLFSAEASSGAAGPVSTESAFSSNLDSTLARPLADRLRPSALADFVGQEALVAQGSALRRLIEREGTASILLWGPPGSGKTTLAHIVAHNTRRAFERLSAVLGGITELREIVARARARRQVGQGTLVFVDEIHRFNRAQQDAFLPHLEDGTLVLIGATTENPSFAVNAAILSRCHVFRLEALSPSAMLSILERALSDDSALPAEVRALIDAEALQHIAAVARGDARRALGLLESLADQAQSRGVRLDVALVQQSVVDQPLLYDKAGEEHYNVTSALIKSLRGSDPDAAIYYLMRMLEAGDDPLFVLRRLLIFASEDVGNADPRALPLVVAADTAFQRMGMPEGLYPIAHACLYLASCPKSNSVGKAFKAAREAIERHGALPVPPKLRNAVTPLMRRDGYGDGYRYPHDEAGNYAAGESYLPRELDGERFYQPSESGFEQNIARRLGDLKHRDPERV
jgi:putative ATPase